MPESAMTQTTNRFFDEVARLMNDAAGVAQGVRREFDTILRAQAERFLRDMDLVKREEFEAVKEMARLAREENEALKARIEALEGKGRGPGEARPAAPGAAPTTMGFPAPRAIRGAPPRPRALPPPRLYPPLKSGVSAAIRPRAADSHLACA